MAKKPYKPSPDHPWNRRIREQVAVQAGRKKPTMSDALVMQSLLEEEEIFDREESAELQRSIQEFFE
jgi:hypothetical protein